MWMSGATTPTHSHLPYSLILILYDAQVLTKIILVSQVINSLMSLTRCKATLLKASSPLTSITMLILATVWSLAITREPEERTLSSLVSSDMANVFPALLSYQLFQPTIHLPLLNILSTRRSQMIHPSRSFASKLLSEQYTSIRKINFESSKLNWTSSLKSITQLQCTT